MKFWLSGLLILLIVDRLTKQLILHWRPANEFAGFIVFNKNPDQAFSLAWPLLIVWPITIILIVYCAFQMVQLYRAGKQQWIAWSLIVIGAMSNLVDRLIYGYVIDFINFKIWPVFNLSDAMIVIGVASILLQELFFSRNKKPPLSRPAGL